MDYKMLNEEYRIASTGYEEFEELGLDRTTIFYYNRERDMIVFSEDHPDTPIIAESLPKYFQLSETEKAAFIENLGDSETEWLQNCFVVAGKIQDTRKARYDITKAVANMPMPERRMKLYFEEMNRRFNITDSSYWAASLFYLLGKVHGIRQERARRRREGNRP